MNRCFKIIVFIYIGFTTCYAQVSDDYTKGKTDFLTGNYEASLKHLLKVKKDSKAESLNYFIAMDYFNLKKHTEAISFFNKELQYNKHNFNVYIKKAQSEKQLGKFTLAVKELNALIKIDSTYYLAYYEKGNINYDCKEFVQAIHNYNKALLIRANFEDAFYKIGFCYLQLKDTTQACNSWNKLEDPDDFEEYKLIEKICKHRTKNN